MRILTFSFLIFAFLHNVNAQTIEFTYKFENYKINNFENKQTLILENTKQFGKKGEPSLPYKDVMLLLPAGSQVQSVEYELNNEVKIDGIYNLSEFKSPVPISAKKPSESYVNESVYKSNAAYPEKYSSNIATQYFCGYSFAIGKFTPARWNPATGELSFYSEVKIKINTTKSATSKKALENIKSSEKTLSIVNYMAQNPKAIKYYASQDKKANYSYLIITSNFLKNGFEPLKQYYDSLGIYTQIYTVEQINTSSTGRDLSEKIRNFIIKEYNDNSIDYVLLGGDVDVVPARGFYCYAVSGEGYSDDNIPADLYYSALDGNFDKNNNNIFGEALHDSCDLLPEIAVGRFSVETVEELQNMLTKTINYQKYPVLADINRYLMLGELLHESPLSMGQDYLRLLIDSCNENGYSTIGIPSSENTIDSLYDDYANGVTWNITNMIAKVNNGSSLIFHSGHSNYNYMMRMVDYDFDETTFNALNGITHSYGILYSHGCICGAFDYQDCISEKALNMKNFLVAAVVNSRYGWFNEGQTEGPSAHLNREFVNAIFNPSIKTNVIGEAHMLSKIATAPWVDLADEYEFGAQRWVHYDNNLLGDPALKIWLKKDDSSVNSFDKEDYGLYPNPSSGKFFLKNMNGQKHCKVFDTNGKCLTSFNTSSQSIDLTHLSEGNYIIQIYFDDKAYSFPVVICR